MSNRTIAPLNHHRPQAPAYFFAQLFIDHYTINLKEPV